MQQMMDDLLPNGRVPLLLICPCRILKILLPIKRLWNGIWHWWIHTRGIPGSAEQTIRGKLRYTEPVSGSYRCPKGTRTGVAVFLFIGFFETFDDDDDDDILQNLLRSTKKQQTRSVAEYTD